MKFTITTPLSINQIGKRSNQEDAIYPQEGVAGRHDRLFVVCDGMGGYEKGEVASRVVSQTLGQWFSRNAMPGDVFTDDMLNTAIIDAYAALDAKAIEVGDNRMGTTLALLFFHRGGALAVHIGDSRIYHIRPVGQNGLQVLYKSRDHSEVNNMQNHSVIGNSVTPRKNVVTKAMTPAPSQRCIPDVAHITDIKAGDYFFLCSDGMLENMCDEQLVDILSAGDVDDRQKLNRLLGVTADNSDNHSAYMITVESVTNELGDERYVNDERMKSDAVSPLLSGAPEVAPIPVEEAPIDVIDEPQESQEPQQIQSPQQPQQPQSPKQTQQIQQPLPHSNQHPQRPQVGPVSNGRVKQQKPANKWLIPLIIAVVILLSALVATLLLTGKDDKQNTGGGENQNPRQELSEPYNNGNVHHNGGGSTTVIERNTTTPGKKHSGTTQQSNKPSKQSGSTTINQQKRDNAIERATGNNGNNNNGSYRDAIKPNNGSGSNGDAATQLRRGTQEVKPNKQNPSKQNPLNKKID